MSHNHRQEYEEFIDKFKPRRTTDDCFTPPDVYEAVVGWLRDKGMISDAAHIVRPFYPGGDFERFAYKPEDVVVDNPPFSIFTKICKTLAARGVRFFLFGPHLTLFSGGGECGRRGLLSRDERGDNV